MIKRFMLVVALVGTSVLAMIGCAGPTIVDPGAPSVPVGEGDYFHGTFMDVALPRSPLDTTPGNPNEVHLYYERQFSAIVEVSNNRSPDGVGTLYNVTYNGYQVMSVNGAKIAQVSDEQEQINARRVAAFRLYQLTAFSWGLKLYLYDPRIEVEVEPKSTGLYEVKLMSGPEQELGEFAVGQVEIFPCLTFRTKEEFEELPQRWLTTSYKELIPHGESQDEYLLPNLDVTVDISMVPSDVNTDPQNPRLRSNNMRASRFNPGGSTSEEFTFENKRLAAFMGTFTRQVSKERVVVPSARSMDGKVEYKQVPLLNIYILRRPIAGNFIASIQAKDIGYKFRIGAATERNELGQEIPDGRLRIIMFMLRGTMEEHSVDLFTTDAIFSSQITETRLTPVEGQQPSYSGGPSLTPSNTATAASR